MKVIYLALIISVMSSCTASKKLGCSCCDKSVKKCDMSMQNDIERQKQASDAMQSWKVKK